MMDLHKAEHPKAKDGAGYAPADLLQALNNSRGAVFAQDHTAPKEEHGVFKALKWADVAIRQPVEAPAESEQSETQGQISGQVEGALPEAGLSTEDHPPLSEWKKDEFHEGMESSINDTLVGGDGTPISAEEEDVAEPTGSVISPADLQKMLDDAYSEGLTAGKAMTESEREAELSAQFERLDRIISRLEEPGLLDVGAMATSINSAVLELASQRVGFVLDSMPDPLMQRIDSLLKNLAHLSGQRELFLAPDDIALVRSTLETRQNPPLVQLHTDPSLSRGDARLRIGGAEMADVLSNLHTADHVPHNVAV